MHMNISKNQIETEETPGKLFINLPVAGNIG